MKQFFTILLLVILLLSGCSKKESNPLNPIDEQNTTDFWVSLNAPGIVNTAAVDGQLTIWAGTDEGIYVKTKSGSAWEKRNSGLTTMIESTLLKISSGGDIYSIIGTKLYQYSHSLQQWIDISKNINTTLRTFDHMHTFSIDNNNNLYAGMFISEKSDPSSIAVDHPGFFRSTDKGQTWERLHVRDYEGEVRSIAFDKSGTTYIIMDGDIYNSRDNGQTFQPSHNGIVWKNPFLIAADSKGVIYSAAGSGLYMSNDKGSTWTNANWDDYCISLGINSSDKIFIGGINSSYYSNDNCQNWEEISSGLEYSLSGFSDCIIQTFDMNGYAYCILESELYKSARSTN